VVAVEDRAEGGAVAGAGQAREAVVAEHAQRPCRRAGEAPRPRLICDQGGSQSDRAARLSLHWWLHAVFRVMRL
jgi:hypothetical protein